MVTQLLKPPPSFVLSQEESMSPQPQVQTGMQGPGGSTYDSSTYLPGSADCPKFF